MASLTDLALKLVTKMGYSSSVSKGVSKDMAALQGLSSVAAGAFGKIADAAVLAGTAIAAMIEPAIAMDRHIASLNTRLSDTSGQLEKYRTNLIQTIKEVENNQNSYMFGMSVEQHQMLNMQHAGMSTQKEKENASFEASLRGYKEASAAISTLSGFDLGKSSEMVGGFNRILGMSMPTMTDFAEKIGKIGRQSNMTSSSFSNMTKKITEMGRGYGLHGKEAEKFVEDMAVMGAAAEKMGVSADTAFKLSHPELSGDESGLVTAMLMGLNSNDDAVTRQQKQQNYYKNTLGLGSINPTDISASFFTGMLSSMAGGARLNLEQSAVAQGKVGFEQGKGGGEKPVSLSEMTSGISKAITDDAGKFYVDITRVATQEIARTQVDLAERFRPTVEDFKKIIPEFGQAVRDFVKSVTDLTGTNLGGMFEKLTLAISGLLFLPGALRLIFRGIGALFSKAAATTAAETAASTAVGGAAAAGGAAGLISAVTVGLGAGAVIAAVTALAEKVWEGAFFKPKTGTGSEFFTTKTGEQGFNAQNKEQLLSSIDVSIKRATQAGDERLIKDFKDIKYGLEKGYFTLDEATKRLNESNKEYKELPAKTPGEIKTQTSFEHKSSTALSPEDRARLARMGISSSEVKPSASPSAPVVTASAQKELPTSKTYISKPPATQTATTSAAYAPGEVPAFAIPTGGTYDPIKGFTPSQHPKILEARKIAENLGGKITSDKGYPIGGGAHYGDNLDIATKGLSKEAITKIEEQLKAKGLFIYDKPHGTAEHIHVGLHAQTQEEKKWVLSQPGYPGAKPSGYQTPSTYPAAMKKDGTPSPVKIDGLMTVADSTAHRLLDRIASLLEGNGPPGQLAAHQAPYVVDSVPNIHHEWVEKANRTTQQMTNYMAPAMAGVPTGLEFD